MARRRKNKQKKGWFTLLIAFFGVKAIIKKLGLDK